VRGFASRQICRYHSGQQDEEHDSRTGEPFERPDFVEEMTRNARPGTTCRPSAKTACRDATARLSAKRRQSERSAARLEALRTRLDASPARARPSIRRNSGRQRAAPHFRLRPSLRLGTEVRTVSRTPEPEDSRVSRFEVALRPTNDAGREERLRYDFVAVCNGVFSQARVPAIDGRQRFAGRVLHLSELTDVLMLEGQRIVVVGAGKSALDCAAWAAQHCRACTLVYRAPHWMVPRYFYDVAGWA
jgi:Flavin-binding monooxygenase-like